MHLQTVNRDQRRERETLPRQRGEEAEETVSLLFIYLFIPSFFFSLSSCPGIVNVLLCPAFPLPPFILQSFLECFLNAKVVCFFFFFFSTPQVHCHPQTRSVPVFPSLFHPTLLDFSISHIFPSLHIYFFVLGLGGGLGLWLYSKRGFSAGKWLHPSWLSSGCMPSQSQHSAAVEPTHTQAIYTCAQRQSKNPPLQ